MRALSLAISLILIASPVLAGSMGASVSNPTNFTQDEVIVFAKKVEKSLGERGARVAIVSRVGRAPKDLPDGINFTHVAYWVYSSIQTPDGRSIPGYNIYNLYQQADALDVSDLVNDFPVDYFAGVHELRAGIVIPKPKVQKAILDVITSDSYKKLHNSHYSVVANPFNGQYQNCMEFTLDVLMSAVYNTDDVPQLKANATAYFDPQKIHLNPLKTLLGPVFVDDFTMKDQKGGIITTTFTTLRAFMQKYDLSQEEYSIH